MKIRNRLLVACAGVAVALPLSLAAAQPTPGGPPSAPPGPAPEPPEFPQFNDIAKGYEKVVSTADGQASLYTIWVREKDGQMLAELPRGYQGQKHLIAGTLAAGDIWAGLHSGIFTADADRYFYWKRFDKRMAMVTPNIGTRSTGDQQSKDSVGRQFTDRVLLDVPIVCMGPNGQPVIDLDELFAAGAGNFFGPDAGGANAKLATCKAKAFPTNVEISVEMPVRGGVIKTFHYSIRSIPDSSGYQPRVADERVGYFTTAYRDLGKFRDDQKWVRYINRWKLEKADPSLKLSPPKEPIIFYIEDTVPVRYRRFVREGLLDWNKAFEKVGIKDAIEVYYQDKATGAHMDKDPEDARYNFIRWLSNDQGTAVGPSRAHPLTGQILDADIVLTDGWIRHFWYQVNDYLPEIVTQGFTPETIAWLDKNPNWDPRIRLAKPEDRDRILAERSMQGLMKYGARAAGDGAAPDKSSLEQTFPQAYTCMAAYGKSLDMALMGMNLEILGLLDDDQDQPQPDGAGAAEPKKEEGKKDEKPKKEEKGDTIDGIPEWFVGPMLRDLVAHEVGHTLGLRHNFKASSIYTLAQINSDEIKGKKPFTGSVMDYNPVNINMDQGPSIQGDFAQIDIGPYDFWAIEYGYTFAEPKDVLKRVAEPELAYGTDEDTVGPDPLIRRYDFTANPLDFANSRMKLVKYHRDRIIEKFVKDGQSWSRARRGYAITLNEQAQMLSMMSSWVGSAQVHRDRKGDPNARIPVEVIPAAQQRAALEFIVKNAFTDEAFGLSADLLAHMTVDKWADEGGMRDLMEDPTWAVHDRIMGIQASTMTMLMNPTTLKRVFDNEFRISAEQDALTLPELFDTVSGAVWTEFNGSSGSGTYTARKPMVSSLRRNLQRELVERLIDLTLPGTTSGAASKPVSNLAVMKLQEIRGKLAPVVTAAGVDAYTKAHASELKTRIDKALDAQYIYNQPMAGPYGSPFMFGRPIEQPAPTTGDTYNK